jgi:glycosyltransferase involved in cell wall biosynthesis
MTESVKTGIISIVMPAYREERAILSDLRAVISTIEALHLDFEIILVVDGSPDKTYENALLINDPRVKVYNYSNNRGKGYALRFGCSRSKGYRIVFLDCGMEIEPSGVALLLNQMDWYGADAVVASKRHPDSKVFYPPARRLTSFGYQLLVKLLFGLNVRDTQTGLKVFRRELLVSVLPRLSVSDYAIDIEILALAYHLGFRKIYEAPVTINHAFESLTRKPMLRSIIKMLWDTLGVFYRLKMRHYYDDKNKNGWSSDPNLEMESPQII